MVRPFRAEEIYDAATDDAAFEQLAASLAESIGARSGVIHWKDFEAETEEVSYSGYFSAGQMEVYERHFAEDDLWSAAVRRPERLNRVWDCGTLVAPGEYETGLLYNEWIRPMGDDSFHGLGGALRTETAAGEIGFHRGRGQPAFEPETLRIVEDGLVHIRRMVAIRSKLVASRRDSASAKATLDVVGHAVFTLDLHGRLLHANVAAERVLQRGDGLLVRGQRLCARTPGDQNALQAALDRAAAPASSEASAVRIHRSVGRDYQLSFLAAHSGEGRQIVAVLTDPDTRSAGLQARMRDLYGLTAAEAEVTERLAEGAAPNLIAEERGVSVSTVQSQLKAIFSKLGCSRQSELAARVGNLPRLQPRG